MSSDQEKELRRIFSDDYWFRIPPFQRPYAWTTDQAGELLDDLVFAMDTSTAGPEDQPPYFLGSVVLIKSPESSQSDVVDGQQRITTLTILLSVLRELTDPEDGASLHKFICERGDKFSGTEDRWRLQVRARDADFFRKYVLEAGGLDTLAVLDADISDSKRRMRENALHLEGGWSMLGEWPAWLDPA